VRWPNLPWRECSKCLDRVSLIEIGARNQAAEVCNNLAHRMARSWRRFNSPISLASLLTKWPQVRLIAEGTVEFFLELASRHCAAAYSKYWNLPDGFVPYADLRYPSRTG
jgi:hypothetical protein